MRRITIPVFFIVLIIMISILESSPFWVLIEIPPREPYGYYNVYTELLGYLPDLGSIQSDRNYKDFGDYTDKNQENRAIKLH